MITPQVTPIAVQTAEKVANADTTAASKVAPSVTSDAPKMTAPIDKDVVTLSKDEQRALVYDNLLGRFKGSIEAAQERLEAVKPSWLDRMLDVKPGDSENKIAIKYDLQNQRNDLRNIFCKPVPFERPGAVLSRHDYANPHVGYERLMERAGKPDSGYSVEVDNSLPWMETKTFTTPSGAKIKYVMNSKGQIDSRDVVSGDFKGSTHYDGSKIRSKSIGMKDGDRKFDFSEHYSGEPDGFTNALVDALVPGKGFSLTELSKDLKNRNISASLMEDDKPHLIHRRGINPDLGTYDESVRTFSNCREDVLAATSNGRYVDPTRV